MFWLSASVVWDARAQAEIVVVLLRRFEIDCCWSWMTPWPSERRKRGACTLWGLNAKKAAFLQALPFKPDRSIRDPRQVKCQRSNKPRQARRSMSTALLLILLITWQSQSRKMQKASGLSFYRPRPITLHRIASHPIRCAPPATAQSAASGPPRSRAGRWHARPARRSAASRGRRAPSRHGKTRGLA